MKNLLLGIVIIFFASTTAAAESSVWVARKGNFVIYLGGTCHVLREADYPLPPEFDQAYRASSMAVFETDISKLQEPATQQKFMAKATYADGSSIDRHLSPRAYAELKAYCDANGIPLDGLAQLRPSMLMVTLTVMELMKMGFSQEGVDNYFHQLAMKDGKAVAGLETVDEQIDFVVSMADGMEDSFVSYSIKDLKEINGKFGDLAGAWRRGDMAKLDKMMVADLKKRWPRLYRKLISDRNRNWLPQIEGYLKTPETEFILVGVAHLAGPYGIITALKKKGYRVEKLKAS